MHPIIPITAAPSHKPEPLPTPVETLAQIDRAHARYPKCKLCGQRVRRLDQYGLCSKVSQPHEDYRATHCRGGRPHRWEPSGYCQDCGIREPLDPDDELLPTEGA